MPFGWDTPHCLPPGPSSWQAQLLQFILGAAVGASLNAPGTPDWGKSVAHTSPHWGAWGMKEWAQQLSSPSGSYPHYEQRCSQGGAEIEVQIHENFCY